MKSYLKSQTLWDAVENDVDPPALRANPTLAQIKKHEEDLAKKPKALTCLHLALSDVIFTRIMACETPKEAWDKLRDEFEGSERVKMVKLLILKMEFEMLRMKDGETIKEYSSKFLDTVNKIRLLGEDLSDLKVVEKMLMSLPTRLPTKVVKGKTPIEAWSEVKPTTKHLKTFRSVCYVHIPNAKRSKLEQKAEMGIFLGYASMTKGYRIYNLQTNKVMISKDVALDENSHWNWENMRVELDDICSK
ncbi:UNVERIFIED_CONTAM: hypothetical protein Sradi_3297400 [Sesamum radiatum]|uniref:Retroviral polymerase SH3-like domain-containing protein n=1 Tax=Sesamum radiatum TaxID=300843 RepID=A0AAW2R181_SESRA